MINLQLFPIIYFFNIIDQNLKNQHKISLNMKYVVTGGAGFIGSNIVKLLVKKGHQVIIIDNLHTGNLSRLKNIDNKISFHKIDIRSIEKIKEIMTDVDGVFHQAALTIVSESLKKKKNILM